LVWEASDRSRLSSQFFFAYAFKWLDGWWMLGRRVGEIIDWEWTVRTSLLDRQSQGYVPLIQCPIPILIASLLGLNASCISPRRLANGSVNQHLELAFGRISSWFSMNRALMRTFKVCVFSSILLAVLQQVLSYLPGPFNPSHIYLLVSRLSITLVNDLFSANSTASSLHRKPNMSICQQWLNSRGSDISSRRSKRNNWKWSANNLCRIYLTSPLTPSV
jgi:hypothetical protein